MSNLSYIEKLLFDVEWRELGAIVKTVTAPSKLNRKSYCDEGKTPIIDQGISFIAGYTNKDLMTVEDGRYIIFGDHSEHIKYVDFPFVQGADGLKILQPNFDNAKYVYYAFQNFYKKQSSYKRHWSTAKTTLIPIPCPDDQKKSLRVQAEIVRILDKFTELTTELTAELNARKQQYNYYRDQLLTFNDNEVEWKTLNEVCSSISAGGDLPESFIKGQTDPTDEFPYPIFANATGDKGLYGFTDKYKIESDAVTISARGAKVGYHTVREGKFTPIVRLITLVPNKSVILTRYLNYILDMTPISGTKGGIPQLTVPTVKKISIPVPPLVQQERIINILDKFEALTTSRTEGLPREIELRQQQYEYYRDLLLNFPKPEVVTHD